ncbi:unnamed protein product [Paramecium pentaurelia]|uniref:Uncharacterized protein n=1 Tax=Paramecium pentaurelia TaxID=43138 RepID=A0A8S1WF71_9CILI|nr:unnamed protein product [Paramecium pentaurelia]
MISNSNICDSCNRLSNEKFLIIPDGCQKECPIGHSYDEDYICYQNNRLLQIAISSNIQTQISLIEQNIIQLLQSAISIRIVVTIKFITNQNIYIYFNERQILTIYINQFIYIDPNTKVALIFQGTDKIRIELNSKIDSTNLIIKFKNSEVSSSIQIEDFQIEQELCVEFCQICKSYNQCQICDTYKKLYNGLCVDKCPESTNEVQNSCFELDEKLDDQEHLIWKILVREFFDISTTKEKIDNLFTLENSLNNNLNFQKGQGIYFSYIPDKRIFGGPFVWVNAQFKFFLKLTEQEQVLKLSFEVFLGSKQNKQNSLHFTVNNNNNVQTLLLSNNQNVLEDHSWDDNYKTQKFVVTQMVYYQSSRQNELNILFHCDSDDNQAFCGIQNFKVISIQCQKGFLFDQYNYYLKQNPCIPICGDNLVVGNEECDDGNLEPFDGCYLCMFQCEENLLCQLSCQICISNMCIQCSQGFYLNLITNQCETICGDSIVGGKEECDDGNLDNYDGCSYCQLVKFNKCDYDVDNSKQKCAVCHFGICIQCNQGYYKEDDNCYSYCGDGLVNEQTEECDNYNEIGCVNCKVADGYICVKLGLSPCLTCGSNCIECQRINQDKLQCLSCLDGYYPFNDECLICDSYCITCKDQPNLCTSCYRNDCELCERFPGLYTDIQLKKCISKCGDGILIKESEACDDGNQNNNDGCNSECSIEYSKEMINSQKRWEYKGKNSYQVYLQNLDLNLNCQSANITIDRYKIEDFQYNFTKYNEICIFQFEYSTSIFKYNTIHVILSISVQSYRILNELDQFQVQFTIEPQEQIIRSETEQVYAEKIEKYMQNFALLILILIPLSIITETYEYLWNILEVLSWINNFYFFNVKYPFVAEYFFIISDWSQIIDFPTFQGWNQPGCDYYFQAPQRFQNKGINPLFINNAQVSFMFICSAIVFYAINYLILILFSILDSILKKQIIVNLKHFSIFNLQKISTLNPNARTKQVIIQYNQFTSKIVIKLIAISKNFKSKIKSTINLCFLDITMAIVLQLTFAKRFENLIITFNHGLAFFSIGLICYQLYQQCQTLNIHKLLAENQQFKEKYEIYYEDINTEISFGYYYKLIGLLRKVFYIFFMIQFYSYPLIQTSLCLISSSLGFILLFYVNPFSNKMIYFTHFISELCLNTIILIVVLLAVHDQNNINFIENNIIIIGWIIISFVVLAVVFEITVLCVLLIKSLYQKLKFILGKNQVTKFQSLKTTCRINRITNSVKQNKNNHQIIYPLDESIQDFMAKWNVTKTFRNDILFECEQTINQDQYYEQNFHIQKLIFFFYKLNLQKCFRTAVLLINEFEILLKLISKSFIDLLNVLQKFLVIFFIEQIIIFICYFKSQF